MISHFEGIDCVVWLVLCEKHSNYTIFNVQKPMKAFLSDALGPT